MPMRHSMTLRRAETMPDEAHAPMPPSPLSPCRMCASGPDSSSTRALVARVTTLTAATIAQSSRLLVQAIPRVPTTGLHTAADLPSSTSFAHTTLQPYPSIAPDTPLHHAGFFFVIIDILIYFTMISMGATLARRDPCVSAT